MRNILYIALCLLTGCLARPPLDKQSFVFADPSANAPKTPSGSRVLGFRSLQVAAPFEGRSFVYRAGESLYERDPYAEFMVPPDEGLLLPLIDGFRATGMFSAVANAGSALKPNTLAEVQVTELYGDFRPSVQPAAVLALRLVFFDAPNGRPGKVIWQNDYARSIPLKDRTAPALIEGWNQALAQIVEAAAQDFTHAEAGAANP